MTGLECQILSYSASMNDLDPWTPALLASYGLERADRTTALFFRVLKFQIGQDLFGYTT